MKKKIINAIVVTLILATLSSLCFTSCSSEPPELSQVKERFTQLIETSAEVNDIFFGEGLSTYERGDEFEHLYYGFYGYDTYEIVTAECPYQSVAQIKALAETVYTTDYLEEIYTMAFDGYADENSDKITTARYLHTGDYFLRYDLGDRDPFNILPGKRIYRYDTMKIGPLSNGKAVNLEIETYLEGQEDKAHIETLRILLVDGEWYLDEPTY